MLHTRLLPSVTLLCCLAWGYAAEASPAQRIAADIISAQIPSRPQQRAHLQALAQGLRAGSVSLQEAEILLRLLDPGLARSAASRTQSAQQVLQMLDPVTAEETQQAESEQEENAREAASIEELERWAGVSSPRFNRPEVAEEADEELASPVEGREQRPSRRADAPALPSDQAALPDLDAQVSLVESREEGGQTITMVFINRGSNDGLETGHRLRIERDQRPIVRVSVFNVRSSMAAALVIDGTWELSGEDRRIEVGDQVVRDR